VRYAVAKGVWPGGIDHHPEGGIARFRERFQGPAELKEARAYEHGADSRRSRLIQSATILAPGFKIGQWSSDGVVPSIMQAIDGHCRAEAEIGGCGCCRTRPRNGREGDHRRSMREIANAHPTPSSESYPFLDGDKKPTTNCPFARAIRRSYAAMTAVKKMLWQD